MADLTNHMDNILISISSKAMPFLHFFANSSFQGLSYEATKRIAMDNCPNYTSD